MQIKIKEVQLSDCSVVHDIHFCSDEGSTLMILPAVSEDDAYKFVSKLQKAIKEHTNEDAEVVT